MTTIFELPATIGWHPHLQGHAGAGREAEHHAKPYFPTNRVIGSKSSTRFAMPRSGMLPPDLDTDEEEQGYFIAGALQKGILPEAGLIARQKPPFDPALLPPLRGLLLDRRLPVEAQFGPLAALIRSAASRTASLACTFEIGIASISLKIGVSQATR